ncbi:MAG: hypothetical protein R6X12_09545 [bacterium]
MTDLPPKTAGESARWEHGSEFHLVPHRGEQAAESPWDGRGVFYATGRDALRGLLAEGRARYGWRRLWLPGYFCQEVVAALGRTGIGLVVYPDGPASPAPGFERIPFERGDALLVVNYFGLRAAPAGDALPRAAVTVIEDHSHDPWSAWARSSNADWCIASLRKTLPAPDGGVLWSPAGHPAPPEPAVTDCHRQAALEKLAAMTLKALYLEGRFDDKELFRRLATAAEGRMGSAEVSGMTGWTRALLPTLPVTSWRERRRRNHRALATALDGISWVEVLPSRDADGGCPFSGILLFDSPGRRERVRERLLAARVYPAILWPLESPALPGIPSEAVALSRRMLSIHCDMRYAEEDMLRVAGLVIRFGADPEARPAAEA